jgi:hypothetical protein
MREIRTAPFRVPPKPRLGSKKNTGPIVPSDLSSAPSPSDINVSIAADSIAHLTNQIDEIIRGEWKRDQVCQSIDLNCGWDRLPSGNYMEKLTIRDIKNVVRPLVENGWHIEIRVTARQKLSGLQNETYHVTPDFLNDITHDEYKERTVIYIYRAPQIRRYVSRSYFLTPLFIVPASITAYVCMLIAEHSEQEEKAGAIVGTLFLGGVITLFAAVASWMTRLKLYADEPGRCGTLVKQESTG